MENIYEKINTHPHYLEIVKHVDKIIESIEYEVDKFRDLRASVIFTGNLNPSTLFTMASHTKYADFTRGIENVSNELQLIQQKYDINLEIEVAQIFYKRFSAVAVKFLDNSNTENAKRLKTLIINRDDNCKLVQDMHNLITNLINSSDLEITKMIRVILKIDPRYKTFMCENPDAQLLFEDSYLLHNIDTRELSIDFIDYAVKFVSKVYQQMFGKKDLCDDDENSPMP
jgi:hypothetical protein